MFAILIILFTLPLLGQTVVLNSALRAKEKRLSNGQPINPMIYFNPVDSNYYYFDPTTFTISGGSFTFSQPTAYSQWTMTRQQGDSLKMKLDSLLVINISRVDTTINDSASTPLHSISLSGLGISHWYTYSILPDSDTYWSEKYGAFGYLSPKLKAGVSYTSEKIDINTSPVIYYQKASGLAGVERILLKIKAR